MYRESKAKEEEGDTGYLGRLAVSPQVAQRAAFQALAFGCVLGVAMGYSTAFS
jgi:hypothetical protein